MGKETLGYPTRTAAVQALRREGRTTREIAKLVGIEVKTVAALEASANRWRSAKTAPIPSSFAIPLHTRLKLRPHAARRNVSVDRLLLMLADAIAEGDLVDAVLDDAEVSNG